VTDYLRLVSHSGSTSHNHGAFNGCTSRKDVGWIVCGWNILPRSRIGSVEVPYLLHAIGNELTWMSFFFGDPIVYDLAIAPEVDPKFYPEWF
jgi:hypothetical protein